MNISKGWVVASVGLVVGIAVSGFGYQEFRKAEVRSVCRGIEQLSGQEWGEKVYACLDAAKAVPFKNRELRSTIAQVEAIAPLAVALSDMQEKTIVDNGN